MRYLEHIKSVWEGLTKDADETVFADADTITRVELLAPALSRADTETVKVLMDSGTIFPQIFDGRKRSSICTRLLAIRCRIPSLQTLVNDLSYVELAAAAMRKVLDCHPRDKRTTFEAAKACYRAPTDLTIEVAENNMAHHAPNSEEGNRHSGYLQLWLHALRHCLELTRCKLRIGRSTTHRSLERENDDAADQSNWSRFGTLAINLGFISHAAKRFSQFSSLSHVPVTTPRVVDSRARYFVGSGPNLGNEQRQGTPFYSSYYDDRSRLYLLDLLQDVAPGGKMTTLFAKRDMIQVFFSFPSLDVSIYPGDFNSRH